MSEEKYFRLKRIEHSLNNYKLSNHNNLKSMNIMNKKSTYIFYGINIICIKDIHYKWRNKMTRTKTLHAVFDGKVLRPEEVVNLEPNVRYLVTHRA